MPVWPFQGGSLCFFLCCVCYAFVHVCLYVPCGHLLGKGWPVVSYCEFVTFLLVSWVRCGTWLYRILIFAPLLTLKSHQTPKEQTIWQNHSMRILMHTSTQPTQQFSYFWAGDNIQLYYMWSYYYTTNASGHYLENSLIWMIYTSALLTVVLPLVAYTVTVWIPLKRNLPNFVIYWWSLGAPLVYRAQLKLNVLFVE